MSEHSKFNQKRYKFNFDAMPHKRWELGLTPYEFIVFEWIWHRCFNGEGECFEKHKSIYTNLGISEKQFYRALKALEEKNVIARQTEKGISSSISVLDQECWVTRKAITSVPQTDVLCLTDRPPLSDRQTPPPSPNISINKKELTRTNEQETCEGSFDPPAEARVLSQSVHRDVEIEIKPIKACEELPEGKRIATVKDNPKKASKASTEASVALHPDLVLQWRGYMEAQAPQLLKSFNPIQAGKELEAVRKYLGCEIGFLFKVLEWVKKHDFWASRAVSIRGLMKKSSGSDLRKIDSIIGQMKTDKSFKRQTILENIDISDDDLYF